MLEFLILFIIIIIFLSNNKVVEKFITCLKPIFQPEIWNDDKKIKKKNNCYSYAIRELNDTKRKKIHPGTLLGMEKVPKIKGKYTCKNFIKNLERDHPKLIKSTYSNKCPCNYYKFALFLDNKKRREKKYDYHFYREDNDGYWSHKPGITKAINVDASNKLILNPSKADRNYYKKYKKNNYTEDCGYFCIPYKDL
tara:strand:+ start:4058 stop:4642 length:585 start_codon:yes stop_codon:yes gene_type:complete